MFVFGGFNEKHQIGKVENCRLTRVWWLSFDVVNGACTNVNDEAVFICFPDAYDSSTGKKCWTAREPLGDFQQLSLHSTYSHRNSRIGNDGGKAVFNLKKLIEFRKNTCCWRKCSKRR